MNRTFRRVAVLIAALASSCTRVSPPAVAAASPPREGRVVAHVPFEGTIRLDVLHASTPTPVMVRYEIRGTDVRYEPVGGAAPRTVHAIADLADGRAYAISDGRKEYIDVSAMAGPRKMAAPRKPHSKVRQETDASFYPTGTNETVAGYDCEDWRMSRGGETIDACVLKGVPFVDLVRSPPYHGAPAWAAELARQVAFPLKLVVRDRDGDEQLRVEAATVEEKPVEAGTFAVPAGYEKIALAKDSVLFGID